jgi:hypothetical protein
MTQEGQLFTRFYDLSWNANTGVFALTWTILHKIDESSPLFGKTQQDLQAKAHAGGGISGTDDTLNDFVHARQTYSAEHIFYNHHFADIMSDKLEGNVRILDYSKFHDIYPDGSRRQYARRRAGASGLSPAGRGRSAGRRRFRDAGQAAARRPARLRASCGTGPAARQFDRQAHHVLTPRSLGVMVSCTPSSSCKRCLMRRRSACPWPRSFRSDASPLARELQHADIGAFALHASSSSSRPHTQAPGGPLCGSERQDWWHGRYLIVLQKYGWRNASVVCCVRIRSRVASMVPSR